MPRFMIAYDAQGTYTFRIMQVVATFLLLEDEAKNTVYYDTLNEAFLTADKKVLPYQIKEPEKYKLKETRVKKNTNS